MIDYEVFARFMARWTPSESRRYEVIKRRHYVDKCPFVEALKSDRPAGYLESARDMRSEDSWDDVTLFQDDPNDRRTYEVSGEFLARS